MSNRTGIKLNPDLLKSHIADVIYEDRKIGEHRVIHCHFVMDNGFVVYGKEPSTSIDPDNFDENLGKKLAYDKTFSQLWELEAYRAVVVQSYIKDATGDPLINVGDYVVKHQNVKLSPAPEYLEGHATYYSIRSHKPGYTGLVEHITFKSQKTDHKRFDEKVNKAEYTKAVEFIRSHMDHSELNSDLVVRIAKICWAARSAVIDTTPDWHEAPEADRQEMCYVVKQLLLTPNDYKPDNNLTKLFWAIVGQFR